MTRHAYGRTLLVLSCILGPHVEASFSATSQNQIPSCYALSKVNVEPPEIGRSLFVLVDQTTVLDPKLKQALFDSVRSALRPGTIFTVVSFSAFSQGRYLSVDTTGVLEQPIPRDARDSISVKSLKSFDSCLREQTGYGERLVRSSIEKIVAETTADLAKSDVFTSLTEVSQIVKQSTAPRRIVLVVSDMLENSTISSFYENNRVRKIDPAKEMKVVEENNVIGDFGGASVYVMGAGLIPDLSKGKSKDKSNLGYRDPKTMGALKQFWTNYFTKSNAKLEEFGMPALLSPVQ